ncbi:hypothetical protein [Variovorax arabinosiphilus]|uniref:hypothetical protein n=1 Tax=Variovorax arabinosiphilus TaxID=3053498 RepID=UPI002575369C|nr:MULTISPECIES: hypothetical protein [unclassified Variovorax]MDM0122286.1 hypothetical protein [Variovorax sp. J2L1-78]MDM0131185.1 hypothetical protein [Variovorax sp. J2L1-63]MDM0235049.1 hypothetical protein [Variovorax sp. J2R1-6]
MALEEENIFARTGYLGCLVATLSLAVAMFLTLRSPLLFTGQDSEIINAALVSVTASLCAICMSFEVYISRATRSPFISLIVGIVATPAFVWIFAFHSILPWAATAMVLIRQIVISRGIRSRSLLAVVLPSAMIGYWVFLLTYVDGYKTPWINEAVATGTVHVDMLFHAAIVNMISEFNAPSLGIDGTTPFPYHFGSHKIAALFCHLLGIGAIKFYAIAFTLLFGPLFILSFFFFSTSFLLFLSRTEYTTARERKIIYSKWFWISFFLVFVGLIPATDRRNLGVWDNAFHSESFGVAILASYLAGIWILDQLGHKISVGLRWYSYPAIGVYLIALCSLKISVGAVVGCLLAYITLRLPLTLIQRSLAWLAMSSALVYGYFATQVAAQGANAGPGLMQMIKPFAFIKDVLPPERWLPSFFAFFGPMIVFSILRLHRFSLPNAPGAIAILNAVPRDVELIIIITLISIAPGLILSVPQGSTNFFAEVSYWWVQPMLSVMLASTFAAFAGLRRK